MRNPRIVSFGCSLAYDMWRAASLVTKSHSQESPAIVGNVARSSEYGTAYFYEAR